MSIAVGGLQEALLISSGITALSNLGSSLNQASAIRAQGNYEATQSEANARRAEMMAEDAVQRGRLEAGRYGQGLRQLQGQQRVTAAAQGLDPNAGSPLDIAEDTARIGALDMLSIETNAAREAFGYKAQAQDYRSRGHAARSFGRSQARGTVLTGGLGFLREAAQYGYMRDKLRPNPKQIPFSYGPGGFGMLPNPKYRKP